jgi:hypothetical protein
MTKAGMMRWTGNVACTGNIRNACKRLVGKPDGKRPHEIRKRKSEDYIKMNLKGIVCEME